MPIWEEEYRLGLQAYERAFFSMMKEIGWQDEDIEKQIQEAILATHAAGATYEIFKKYLLIPELFLMSSEQLQFVIDTDRELIGTEWDVFESDFQALEKKYKQNPQHLNDRFLVSRFQSHLDNELKQGRSDRQRLIQEKLKDVKLVQGEPPELAAIYANRAGYKFVDSLDKVDEILKGTPLFGGGNLARKYQQGQWGDWEFLSKHAVAIIGKTKDGRYVICDPLHPEVLRFEKTEELFPRLDKLYYTQTT